MSRKTDVGVGLIASTAFAGAALFHSHAVSVVACVAVGTCGVGMVAFDVGRSRALQQVGIRVGASTENPLPDFTPEIRVAQQMLAISSADPQAVDDWIQKVHDELLGWRTSAAEEFSPVALRETPESWQRRQDWYNSPVGRSSTLEYVLGGLYGERMPETEYDPSMKRLKDHYDRLIRILERVGK